MKRYLEKLIFRIRMLRFAKPPTRSADGRFICRKAWRLEQMRGQA